MCERPVRKRFVRGSSISYIHQRRGSEAVLLIHGNSSANIVFARQMAALRAIGLSVVAPDLPGHGRSDDAANPVTAYSFPGYAKILAGLMDNIGYASYHVIGWSLGGHIGLEMLGTTSAVKSLLISGTPPIKLSGNGVAAGFRWTATTALAGRARMLPEQITRYANAMIGGAITPHGKFRKLVERTDGAARFWMVRNGINGVGLNQMDVVANSSRPIAIIQGRSDPFIQLDHIRSLRYRNIWSGGPLFMNGGHAVHWTHANKFNCLMSSFLLDYK